VSESEADLGKVAVVTGAGSLPGRGMGRAISLAMMRKGYSIVAVDRDPDAAKGTVEAVVAAGGAAVAVTADLTVAADIGRIRDEALTEFGRIDVLFNHAGFGAYNSVLETDDDLWDHMIELNLTSAFRMTRAVLPHMLERGTGVIVNTISSAGIAGGRAGAGYTAAKHGLVGLTRSTAVIYADRGIRAVGVCPGYTRSGAAPQISTSDSETAPLLDAVTAINVRDGKPEELAEVFAFVASDAASYLNGAIIPVDGGWTAF
jgi:NAD(P)-dependent dehydrogenase (short-subunit alcohol dehydrogenase family)